MAKKTKILEKVTKHLDKQMEKKESKIPYHLTAYLYIVIIAISFTLYIVVPVMALKIFFALLGIFTMMYAVIIGVIKAMSTGVPWAIDKIREMKKNR